MRGSAKGDEPEELLAWKAGEENAGLEPRYEALSKDARTSLHLALFVEQTGQCLYCGRGIRIDRGQFHIEHFRPRRGMAARPDLEVAYENLFLSCEGPASGTQGPRTCGHRKGDWFDESCHIAPVPEDDCQRRFRFGSNGRIHGNGTRAAETMITFLNLNHPELIEDRSKLIENLDADLKNVDVNELILVYSALMPSGARGSFAHVAIQYLCRERDRS